MTIAGIPESERLTCLATAIQSCGWWWPHHGFVVLTDRPTTIRRDPQGRFHSDHGPALTYDDGYNLYSWHGVTISADPDVIRDLKLDEIMKEPNSETRRCMIEIIGWATLTSQMTLIAEDTDPGNPPHKLALYDIPGSLRGIYPEPARILICTNGTPEKDGTRRRYGLPVPAAHTDPVAAAAALANWPVETYRQLQRRA